MHTFLSFIGLTAPLFVLVLLGYALTRWAKWPKPVSDALTQFVFPSRYPRFCSA
jgi:malonate transporter